MNILKNNKGEGDWFLLFVFVYLVLLIIISGMEDNRRNKIASQIVAGQALSKEDYDFCNNPVCKDLVEKKIQKIKKSKEEKERKEKAYLEYLDSLKSK